MWQLRLARLTRGRTAHGALRDSWQAPLPARGTDWREVPFLVCDAEMSSLDPADGELLSLGWVRIEAGGIELATSKHHLVRASGTVGQSATIHQIRDIELAQAAPLPDVLDAFLEAARGCVLVFHNAKLDLAFLDRESTSLFGAPVLLPTADTFALEQRLLRRRDTPIGSGDLRLQACRDRYGLPAYPAHNAMLDALATAELLLAHIRHRAGTGRFQLSQLLQRVY